MMYDLFTNREPPSRYGAERDPAADMRDLSMTFGPWSFGCKGPRKPRHELLSVLSEFEIELVQRPSEPKGSKDERGAWDDPGGGQPAWRVRLCASLHR